MRIGLFLSRAGGRLAEAVNLEELREYFTARGECQVSLFQDFFDPGDLERLLEEVRQNSYEAVILAGESPLAYYKRQSGDLIVSRLEELGLNFNRIGFVNLLEQVALVHQGRPQEATEKAKGLVAVELGRVRNAPCLKQREVVPRRAVAVVGPAAAGYLVAQRLLARNYRVYMVEPCGQAPSPWLGDSLGPARAYVENHPAYRYYPAAELMDFDGYAGDYLLQLRTGAEQVNLAVGAVVLTKPEDAGFNAVIRNLVNLAIDEAGGIRPRNQDTLQAYSSEEGVFLAAAGPDIKRVASGADAAALAVLELLERPLLYHINAVSEVDQGLCGGCGICVKTCMFHACRVDSQSRVAIIDPRRCKGCGNCVTACPTGARDLLTYPKNYLFQAVYLLGRLELPGAKVLALLCEGCGYEALDAGASKGAQYPVGVLPLRVRCGGTVDTQLILHAFQSGFAGVIICKCPDGHCANVVGNIDLDRRANLFREILHSRGLNTERLRIVEGVEAGENRCLEAIADLYLELAGKEGVQ